MTTNFKPTPKNQRKEKNKRNYRSSNLRLDSKRGILSKSKGTTNHVKLDAKSILLEIETNISHELRNEKKNDQRSSVRIKKMYDNNMKNTNLTKSEIEILNILQKTGSLEKQTKLETTLNEIKQTKSNHRETKKQTKKKTPQKDLAKKPPQRRINKRKKGNRRRSRSFAVSTRKTTHFGIRDNDLNNEIEHVVNVQEKLKKGKGKQKEKGKGKGKVKGKEKGKKEQIATTTLSRTRTTTATTTTTTKKPSSLSLSSSTLEKLKIETTRNNHRKTPTLPLRVTKILSKIRKRDSKKSTNLKKKKKNHNKIWNTKRKINKSKSIENALKPKHRKCLWKIQIKPEDFLLLITDKKLEIFQFICKAILTIPQREPVAKYLFKIFEWEYHYKNLFRINSLATKLLSVFSEQYGKEYLIGILALPIKSIIEKDSNFEIDPNRIMETNNEIDLKKNKLALQKKVQDFFNIIFNSVEQVPIIIREICYYIRKITKKKFPEMELLSVGAFFFLRFICPAITSPQNYGIINTTIPHNGKRALMFLTKIIQVISNNATFSKISYMNSFNDFITQPEILQPMFSFLEQLSSLSFVKNLMNAESVITKKQSLGSSNKIKEILENYCPNFQKDFEKIHDRILLKK
ncbi:ras gtpase-activating protein [Anaeramoeba flamelloides]|uniref:Ras gtpase-activating protein n=1 Tax=Anaeramoeba flamelloides TaxID=1746091 RepID=A0ABQ8YXY5_9EUKA|nr:ras gtpase-activating protein [Anaeramoeba flamelloides]